MVTCRGSNTAMALGQESIQRKVVFSGETMTRWEHVPSHLMDSKPHWPMSNTHVDTSCPCSNTPTFCVPMFHIVMLPYLDPFPYTHIPYTHVSIFHISCSCFQLIPWSHIIVFPYSTLKMLHTSIFPYFIAPCCCSVQFVPDKGLQKLRVDCSV